MKQKDKQKEIYTFKLNEFQRLAQQLDKEVNRLCEVFPSAFESELVTSAEEILASWILSNFGQEAEDMMQDWRFVHEYGSKSPMEFIINDSEENETHFSAKNNEELAEAITLICDLKD